VAAASVVLLWWGGSQLVVDLLTRLGVPALL
jgi:hypothetical protein